MAVERGRMIVVEGMDASGKATQTKKLVERLQSLGLEARRYEFPTYTTEVGKAIGTHLQNRWQATSCQDEGPGRGMHYFGPCQFDPLVFQALMTLNRYELAPFLLRDLAAGVHVVCDRYWPSGVAYGTADGIPMEWLVQVHLQLPQPDLMMFLDIQAGESVVRRPDRRDRYERQAGLMDQVREHYATMFRDCPLKELLPATLRWATLDGQGSVEQVHGRIWEQVVGLLK